MAKVVERIDSERVAVARALGVEVPSIEALRARRKHHTLPGVEEVTWESPGDFSGSAASLHIFDPCISESPCLRGEKFGMIPDGAGSGDPSREGFVEEDALP